MFFHLLSPHGDDDLAHTLFLSDPPRNTSLSIDPSGPVPDGSTVTLTCLSVANPASINFTWYRVTPSRKEKMGSEQEITFNVTKLSEDQFYCEALNVHGTEDSESVEIDVTCEMYLFFISCICLCFPRSLKKHAQIPSPFPVAPEVLPSSRCIRVLSRTQCSCNSQGNPPPSLVWELAGEPVNNSADLQIREVPLGDAGMRSIITLQHLDDDMPSLACLSINALGSDSFTFNISSSETEPGRTIILHLHLSVDLQLLLPES